LRTWSFSDNCGNTTAQTWTVTVIDDEAPVLFGVPDDVTLECGEDVLDALVFGLDNCSENVVVGLSASTNALPCGYEFIRIWTGVDDCGNTTTASQTITFIDTTSPIFLTNPAGIIVQCGDPVPGPSIPLAADVCDGPVETVVTSETIAGGCANTYTIQYTFQAFDGCGNFVTWGQEISVVDTEGPVFDPYEAEVLLPCTAYNGVLVSATDACSTTTLAYTDNVVQVGCNGIIIRTYTATDACGNVSTAVQTITIFDDQPPVITSFPMDVVVSCDNVPTPNEADVEYFDLCSAVAVVFTEEYVEGDCINSYTLLRTWSFSDNCGNTTAQTWTVTVIDDEAPVLFGVPDDVTLECGDDVPDAIVFALDNCSGILAVGISASTEPTECGEIFTRTWFTTDDCGNLVQATQVVTFSDFTAPVLSANPADIQLLCGDEIPAPITITATDNCDASVVVIFEEINPGNCGDITRTWCATDCSGNESCWTQTITILSGIAEGGNHGVPDKGGNEDGEHISGETLLKQGVQLYNMQGEKIMEMDNYSSSQQIKAALHNGVFDLATGIYLVRFGQGVHARTEKIFIISSR